MGGLPFGTPPPPQQPWQAPAPMPVGAAGAPSPMQPGTLMDGSTPTAPEPDSTSTYDEAPRRRRRSLKIDKDAVNKRVMESVDKARDERSQWMDERLIRYAKLRGWRQKQTWPWEGAHNEHVRSEERRVGKECRL